jgi:hypothetical protein
MKNNKISSSVIRLYFDRSFDKKCPESKDLRGAIAGLYTDEILLHQHYEDGTVKYNYPLVQYKFIQGKCLIVGIDNGAKVVSNLNLIGEVIILSHSEYRIFKKDVSFQELSYGVAKTMSSYSFLTPWLALNEKNYEEYQKVGTWAKRKALLEKILIGNIISMSKSLGYTVPEPIKANIGKMKEVTTSLKGTPMLGFLGTFSVNFEIPDYWGIGKSVSRGFGTIKRVKELESQRVEGINSRKKS